MVRMGLALAVLGTAFATTMAGTPASAEVRDAVYRGTMVCDKLPFYSLRKIFRDGIRGVRLECSKFKAIP